MIKMFAKPGPDPGRRIRSRWLCLFLVLIMAVCLLAGCGSPQGGDPQENAAELVSVADGPQEEEASQDGQTGGYTESGQSQNTQTEGKPAIDENGSYSSKEDVALYIHTYGKLPPNYITKKEAAEARLVRADQWSRMHRGSASAAITSAIMKGSCRTETTENAT